ncbi:MAG: carboxymuconolactone decarboxylase family protein [Thiomargarita sp.]|nr:carboxymuconolactone decarboxylase family protein [Thiomargarita sp.]
MRITEKPLHEYPWYLRPLFWAQKKKYKHVLKSALLWARVPRLFGAIAIFYGGLDRKTSPLDPVLRSLITVRVSQINWCHFCVDLNSSILLERAGSMDKASAVEDWKTSALFDDKEKIALEYAEVITYSDQQVSDELMTRLHDFFDDDTIVELTGLIAFQNMSSKFNSALDVPAQGFCQIPQK